MKRALVGAAVGLVLVFRAGVDGRASAAPASESTAEDLEREHKSPTSTKFIPVPLYAHDPNEGSTYGVLPVFLNVSDATQRTLRIFAPSASWNSVVKVSGTLRLYLYPRIERAFMVILSASWHVNRTLIAQFSELPRTPGRWTTEASLVSKRNIFYRFYGLGPDTSPDDVSSHTRLFARFDGRLGYNLARSLNLGLMLRVRADEVEGPAVPGLPLTTVKFANVPGVAQAAGVVSEGVSLRFDTRELRDYSDRGLSSDLSLGLAEGFLNAPVFGVAAWDTRLLVPETSFLQGAARLYWTHVIGGGDEVPFMYQSALGGDTLLRGFNEGRFYDRGAWSIDFEQRLRALQTHMFGVVADWRLDPFVTIGQVYGDFSGIVSHVRVGGGLGMRAWVRPNVVGRIDLAGSGDGFKAYIVLGYPF